MAYIPQQVQLANALVSNLDIFDGAGYDLMGSYSQDFLRSIANYGSVDSHIDEYLEDIKRIHKNASWIESKYATKSLFWIMRVQTYVDTRNSSNFRLVNEAISNIIDFEKQYPSRGSRKAS